MSALFALITGPALARRAQPADCPQESAWFRMKPNFRWGRLPISVWCRN